MAANPNIFSQYLRPVKSVQEYGADMDAADMSRLQLEAQRRQNVIAELTQQRQMRADQARQGLLSSLGPNATPQQVADAYMRNPDTLAEGLTMAEKLAKLQKEQAEGREKTAAATKAEAGLPMAKQMAAIAEALNFQTREEAAASLARSVTGGGVPMQLATSLQQMIMTAPDWRQRMAHAAIAEPQDRLKFLLPEYADTGGALVNKNPLAGQVAPIQKTQTPDSIASNARQAADAAASRAQAERLAMLPTFDATAGAWVDRRARTVTPATGPDGKPLAPKASAATEDERKAAGWLAQADNAWKNMRAVAFDANGNIKDPAKPGFNDALAGVPSFGFAEGVANVLRGEDRLKFLQAASSLSESLLRAATGAGVNESEARQKIKELTPVIGDNEASIRQKFEAIPMYLESLRTRAGRAAPAGYTPPAVPGAQPGPALQMPGNPNADAMQLFNAADAIINGGR